jgi:hypothetical protein
LPSKKKKPAGAPPPRQFRLGEDVMRDLQDIADVRTTETGVSHSRADAIRVLVKEEKDRIRRRAGK